MAELVLFWASWCLACKSMQKTIPELELEGIEIKSFNVDKNFKMADDYNIQAVPTCLLLQEGKEVDRLIGAQTTEGIKNWIEGYSQSPPFKNGGLRERALRRLEVMGRVKERTLECSTSSKLCKSVFKQSCEGRDGDADI